MIIGLKVPGLHSLIISVRWVLNVTRTKLKTSAYFDIKNPESGSTYMKREWLIKPNRLLPFSARFQDILTSDPQDCHDHPWACVSLVLDGGYWEECFVPQKRLLGKVWPEHKKLVFRSPGSIIVRSASARHRLIVPEGGKARTLFFMGTKKQFWGFYPTSDKKVYWRDYLDDWTTPGSDEIFTVGKTD